MTDITKLGLGAQFDILVAERVMGWTSYTYEKEGSVHIEWREALPGGGFRMHQEWSPSTNIAAAWQVWGRLAGIASSENWEAFCEALGILGDKEREYDGRDQYVGSTCDHAPMFAALRTMTPLKICMAALRAVGS